MKKVAEDYIISLGEDCFPRSFIDRFTLQPRFPVRMPFDGSVHPYGTVCHLIANDFQGYLDGVVYTGKEFRNSKYRIAWNHEKTEMLSSFIEQNKKRITQFRKVMAKSGSILFFLHAPRNYLGFDCSRLNSTISAKYPHLRFRVFILNENKNFEYVRYEQRNTIYINLPWDPPEQVDKDPRTDFIKQMYETEYGRCYAKSLFRELFMGSGREYDEVIMVKEYRHNEALDADRIGPTSEFRKVFA